MRRHVDRRDIDFDLVGFANSMAGEKDQEITVQAGVVYMSKKIKEEFPISD